MVFLHLTKYNTQYLKQFVNDINTKFANLDFVIFTGDNLDKADKSDLKLFLDIIKHIKFKTYIIPGNHDLYSSKGMTKEYYMHTIRKKLGFYHSSKPNYIIKKGDIVFITMNGVKEVIPGPGGYYHKDELEWLDKNLNKYYNKKVVIIQHFPLLDTKILSHKLHKKEDYENILAKHNNVVSIVSGHYHKDKEEQIENIYHIITKNFSNFNNNENY